MPPPRRAGLPFRLTFLLAVAGLLLGLFVVGSGRALWEAGKLFWIGGAGRTVRAPIVSIQTEPDPEKGKPPHQVAIRYEAALPSSGGFVRRFGWVGLEREKTVSGAPPRYQIGQTLPVRYAPWFGGVASHPWQPSPAGWITSLTLSGSLVLLVSLLLGRRLARWVGERRRLLRDGQATVGTITHKRTEAEDMVRYFLRYGYAAKTGALSEGREREEQVSMEQWKRFEVGQPVTVLYDPNQPEQAALYALIGHG